MATQVESQADRISRLQKLVQEKRISAATLQARKEELQKRLDDARKECKEVLGIEPEALDSEIVRLSGIIEQKINQVQSLLSGAST